MRHLSHLTELQHLDLSSNLLEDIEDMNELPPNLLSLKMIGNPMEQRAVESRALAEYRKPFVLHLSALVDLDKLEIMPAERMGYQGILRRGVNLNDMLFAKIRNDEIRR